MLPLIAKRENRVLELSGGNLSVDADLIASWPKLQNWLLQAADSASTLNLSIQLPTGIRLQAPFLKRVASVESYARFCELFQEKLYLTQKQPHELDETVRDLLAAIDDVLVAAKDRPPSRTGPSPSKPIDVVFEPQVASAIFDKRQIYGVQGNGSVLLAGLFTPDESRSRVTALGQSVFTGGAKTRHLDEAAQRQSILSALERKPESYRSLSPVWQNDRETALLAIRLCPSLARDLPLALRDDPAFALAMIVLDPHLYQTLGARAQLDEAVVCRLLELLPQWSTQLPDAAFANERIAVAAVAADKRAFFLIPEPLRYSFDVLLAAKNKGGDGDLATFLLAPATDVLSGATQYRAKLKMLLDQHPLLLGWCSDQVKNDPELVGIAVRRSGLALRMASERMRANRDIVLAAVAQGEAFVYVSAALRADREVALAAVRAQPRMYLELNDKLKNDPSIAVAAATRDRSLVGYLPEQIVQDRELAVTIGASNHLALMVLPTAFSTDTDFWLDCAGRAKKPFPAMINELALLKKKDPALYQRWRRTIAGAHIACLSRFSGLAALKAVIEAATPHPGDTRPLALVLATRADYNGFFEATETALKSNETVITQLMPHYRVLYREYLGEEDELEQLDAATHDAPVDHLTRMVHGTEYSTQASFSQSARVEDGGHWRGYASRLKPGATVVMFSCSTGKQTMFEGNVANMLSAALPEVTVFAPTEDILSAGYQFDQQGRVNGVRYAGKGATTYEVGARGVFENNSSMGL